jgi:hypothetical protein
MSSGLLVAGFLLASENAERIVARGFITATKRHCCSIPVRIDGLIQHTNTIIIITDRIGDDEVAFANMPPQ